MGIVLFAAVRSSGRNIVKITVETGEGSRAAALNGFGVDGTYSTFLGLGEGSRSAALQGLGITGANLISSGFGILGLQAVFQGLKDTTREVVTLQYGYSAQAVHSLMNEIRGTMEGVRASHILALVNAVTQNDPQTGLIAMATALQADSGALVATSSIAAGARAVSAVLNRISQNESVQSVQVILSAFQGGAGHFITRLALSGAAGGRNAVLGVLSGEEATRIHAMKVLLEETAYIRGVHSLSNTLHNVPTQVFHIPYRIYLDGEDISQRVFGEVNITFNESQIHNEITLSSIDDTLFDKLDPAILAGHPRVEVHIGNRVMNFLVEDREGSADGNFTLWGRDYTAMDNAPWAESSTVLLDTPALASEVAAGVLHHSALDWEVIDWMLPETFEVTGTPVEILQLIAQEVGAIVRAKDDGSFTVRPKYPVRPIHLGSTDAAMEYLASDILNFAHQKNTGAYYSSVVIRSDVSESQMPQVVVEDIPESIPERLQTTDAFIRVYWAKDDPEVQSTYVTDGTIETLQTAQQEEITEIVEFKEGKAETEFPIASFDTGDVTWIGQSSEIEDYNYRGKTISLSDSTAFRLARIKYTTEYTRYKLSGHDVELLLAVFFFAEFPAINLLVRTPPIARNELGELVERQGDPITATYLTTEAGAVALGEAWIDDNKYDFFTHTFESPYRDGSVDGIPVWVDCPRVGSPGNYHVTQANILISGPKVVNSLQVTKWQV